MKAEWINRHACGLASLVVTWLVHDTAALRAADPPTGSARVGERIRVASTSATSVPSPALSISNSLPELQLTGLIDLSVKKWVFLVKAERGQPVKQYSLREGERADDLEIVSIDVRAEKVVVRNAGVEMTLTFKTHGRAPAEQALMVEKQFVDDHLRAHELHEQRERERIERERAEVNQLLASPASDALPLPEAAGGSAPVVSSAVFSPDGTLVLTRAPDGTLRIGDAASGRPAPETPLK